MTGPVIADAGPLIALAKVGRLELLQRLYGNVLITPAVHDELQLRSQRPGAVQIARALDEGWLMLRKLTGGSDKSMRDLLLIVDAGEAEAILLAERIDCRFLLIDDRQGRRSAKRRHIPVAGVAGVLLAARQHGLVDAVLPILKEMAQGGYRLSSGLISEVARLAGEDSDL